MSLKYTFRHLFFKGILRPKRLYALLEDLDNRIESASGGASYDDTEIKADIAALDARIKALEDA